jgi:hypothetical protein
MRYCSRWFLAIVFIGFALVSIKAQEKSPRLVVFIHVDELQTEHLLAFNTKFGKYGFNQLTQNGAFFHSADYETTSSYFGTQLLNMYTGCYPNTHGVISNAWYPLNKQQREIAFRFEGKDKDFQPDSGNVVPLDMTSTTITNELSLFYGSKSKIASVGYSAESVAFFNPSQASDAYWFNRTTGAMVSYAKRETPEWVKAFNDKGFAGIYANRQWGPLTDLKSYHEFTYGEKQQPKHFLYDLNGDAQSKYPFNNLIKSPYGNMIIRDFTAALLMNESFGKDKYPDMLSVSFSCKSFIKENHELFDAEVEDMLLRLDEQIASMVQLIKEQVGLEHTLFVFTSTPSVRRYAQTLQKHQINAGYFNGKKTAALLNLYLMAVYGQGKWIKGYHDKQFYLNQALIEKTDLSFNEIQEKAMTFLLEVAGIDKAITGYHLRTGHYPSGIYHQMQKSYYYGRSGDILIALKPGWSEELEGKSMRIKGHHFNIPLILYGWQVPSVQILDRIKMINVAPTIAAILKIPVPNGCIGNPIKEVFVK